MKRTQLVIVVVLSIFAAIIVWSVYSKKQLVQPAQPTNTTTQPMSVNDYGITKESGYYEMTLLAVKKLSQKLGNEMKPFTYPEYNSKQVILSKCGFFCTSVIAYIEVKENPNRVKRYNYSCYMTFDSSGKPSEYEFHWTNSSDE